MPEPHYLCPKCREAKGLWRGIEVPGWEAIGSDLKPTHSGHMDREVEWNHATPDGTYGCGECTWEGRKNDLLRIGIDGEPLPAVHPAQERLV